ncbi:MAG: flexitail domain-containing putative surface protein [Dehalococcoidia bacterium]
MDVVVGPNRELQIANVEFTQAIQELNPSLADLQANGPKVPIVKGKPAVMRVMLQQVSQDTPVRVEATGSVSHTRFGILRAPCDPQKQRRREDGCVTADFYFTPGDNVSVTVKLKDERGKVSDSEAISFSTRTAKPIVLVPVKVCDAKVNGRWLCSNERLLAHLIPFLRSSAPTNDVRTTGRTETVRVEAANHTNDFWDTTVHRINNLWAADDRPPNTYYYGMVRTYLGPLGLADDIPSRGAASTESFVDRGVEVNDQTVAHETAHMLGRKHTNTDEPQANCALAPDQTTDWPYSNNSIQDLGFDLTGQFGSDPARQLIRPEGTFDWMSYCVPTWISPFTYTKVSDVLLDQEGAGAADVRQQSLVTADFWNISGRIEGGTAALDPLFTLQTKGSGDAGSGTYRIDVEDSTGSILFARFFEPTRFGTRTTGTEIEGMSFTEMVPVTAGAASIIVRDPLGATLGTIMLGGASPSVTIGYPAGGETLSGEQQLTWTATDPDSSSHTFRVEYSADGGGTWQTLSTDIQDTSLVVDFNELPGSAGNAVVRVLASDGANTGVAVSQLFTVPTKGPQAEIVAPDNAGVYDLGDLVWLQALAWDPEGGYLDGTQVQWQSSRDGLLGSGQELHMTTLSAGVHTITLTVTDADGNQATAAVTVTVNDPDTDGDGCGNNRELGANPSQGGQRDPLSFWDFMDQYTGAPLARDEIVSVGDIGAVVARFGATGNPTGDPLQAPEKASGYHTIADRNGSYAGQDPWDLLPPDGNISVGDIGAVVGQFGHTCFTDP